MAKAKYHKDGEGGREALVVKNCGINIWDGLELKLVWSKKSSSYIENYFPIFLLSGISNTSICKVRDGLHWVNFLETKTFSNSFRSLIIFYIQFFLLLRTSFIYIKSFFIKPFRIKKSSKIFTFKKINNFIS